jgi:hypothetical protein
MALNGNNFSFMPVAVEGVADTRLQSIYDLAKRTSSPALHFKYGNHKPSDSA